MISISRLRLLATAGVLALSASGALAQAVDGEAFASRLAAISAEEGGTPVTYASATTDGDTVTLTGVQVGEGESALKLDTLRFEGVSGSDADGWRADRIPIEDAETTQEGVTTSLEGLIFEGLTIAPEGETAEDAFALQVERVAFDAIRGTSEGDEAFRLTGFTLDNAPGENGGFDIEFSLDEFFVDTTAAPGSEPNPAVAALGYEQMSGAMSGSALWETDTGELTLSPLLINVEDAGELTFAYSITGYTPAFVRQLTEAQQRMAANPDDSGSGLAMLGLVSQLNLVSAEIAFTDASLTNRLLDYYAEQNGQDRDELIDTLIGMLPMAFSYVNDPAFQTQASEAVEAFLRDPQSLSIAVAPSAPIPAAQIVAAAAGAPATLPSVLALTVDANE